MRQFNGQLRQLELKERKSTQECKRLQAIILERDQDIQKLQGQIQSLHRDSSRVIAQLKGQL